VLSASITLRMLSETGRGSGGRDSGGCPMNLEMGPTGPY